MSEVETKASTPAAASPGKTTVVEESAAPEVSENGNGVHPEEVSTSNGHAAHDGDEGEESDEYDFEEEQQAVEGEDDEYEYDEDDEEEYDEGAEVAHQNGKSSLTALLLGDHTISTAGGDDEGDDEDADEDDEYYEEPDPTPITPTTSKKRSIDEALEDAASPKEESESKKVKA